MSDTFAQFRKTTASTPSESAFSGADEFCAFGAKDRVERLKIKRANCPALPVHVLRFEIHGVALRRAGFPKQFQIQLPLGVFLFLQNAFMLCLRDAAPVFGFVFRPQVGRNDGNGNPAKMHGEIVKPFQKLVNGNLVFLEHGKEIIGGGFHQFLISQGVKRGRFEHAFVTLAAAVFASALHLLHDNLPCALHKGVFAIAVVVGNKVPAEVKREVPAKLQFNKADYSLRAEYAGPQGQLVFIQHFPVLFRDGKTAKRKVDFAKYASWMGTLREDASIGVFPELGELFTTGKWGMSTNDYRLNILGEVSPGDIVQAKLWQERNRTDARSPAGVL